MFAHQVSPMRCGEREVMVFPGFKAGSIQLVSDDDDDDDAVWYMMMMILLMGMMMAT